MAIRRKKMRIGLVMENSQADKNPMVYECLKEIAAKYGHEVFNYGMYSSSDECQITYVKAGLIASILLNTKAVDFIVTGCGTGEGAMLALNAFPGTLCGHIVDPEDAFMFMQINDGNAIALPYAKGMGWGSELRLKNIFEQLFIMPGGNGYPKDRVVPEQRNKKILDGVKKITHTDMLYILRNLDQEFVTESLKGEHFKELFEANCDDSELSAYVKTLL